MPARNRWISLLWGCAGSALVAIAAWQSVLSSRPQPSATTFVASQLVAGIVYLAAVYAVLRRPGTLRFGHLLAVGLLCRLVMLPSAPLFDDDIYRYLWDGKVLAHGINPFLYPPGATELASLRDANWARVGYPEIRTIYPPLAQLLFGLAHVIGVRTVLTLKCLFFVFDAANMLLIGALLVQLGRPRSWALIYAWSPLAAKEFANSGHLEPVMLFFVLGACYLWLKQPPKRDLAGASFGAALSVKFIPGLLAPIFWRIGSLRSLAWAAGVFAVLYLPFLRAGGRLFTGAWAYARHWAFNYGAFGLLSWLQSWTFPSADAWAIPPARLVAALATAAYALHAGWRLAPRDSMGAMRTARNVLALCLFLAPTVDPWYVCWLLPFLAVASSAGLLLLTVTCSLSYLYYAGHTFPAWIPVAEYAPVYLLLLVEFWWGKRPGVRRARARVRRSDPASTI